MREKSAFVNAVSIVTFATVQCNLPLIVTAVIYQFAINFTKLCLFALQKSSTTVTLCNHDFDKIPFNHI